MKINEHSFENLLSMERVEWQALRQQVGDQVVKALEGCEHITATGHSIGAALAAVLSAKEKSLRFEAFREVFQWEHSDRGVQQPLGAAIYITYIGIRGRSRITMGQNVAWYGRPPDVGCRGKRLYASDDPAS